MEGEGAESSQQQQPEIQEESTKVAEAAPEEPTANAEVDKSDENNGTLAQQQQQPEESEPQNNTEAAGANGQTEQAESGETNNPEGANDNNEGGEDNSKGEVEEKPVEGGEEGGQETGSSEQQSDENLPADSEERPKSAEAPPNESTSSTITTNASTAPANTTATNTTLTKMDKVLTASYIKFLPLGEMKFGSNVALEEEEPVVIQLEPKPIYSKSFSKTNMNGAAAARSKWDLILAQEEQEYDGEESESHAEGTSSEYQHIQSHRSRDPPQSFNLIRGDESFGEETSAKSMLLPELHELANLIRMQSLPTVQVASPDNKGEDSFIRESMKELAEMSEAHSINKERQISPHASRALLASKAGLNDTEAGSSAEATPAIPKIDRSDLLGKFQALLERREKCKTKNLLLQQKLGEYFKRKRPDDSSKDSEKTSSDWEQRYAGSLGSLTEMRAHLQTINETNANIVFSLKNQIEEKKLDGDCLVMDFNKLRKSSIMNSENSRTGKNIPSKVVELIEQQDTRKEQEITVVRLENIKLRNKIRRQEQILKQKEELGDGLHLIDFEQLKIENQSHNEKIEDRNEELLKLRKKITNIVQVLTHVKEKLKFVERENHELKVKLKSIDQEVTKRRDEIPLYKLQRDRLRSSNTNIRQKNGLLGNFDLLFDFETKKNSCESLQDHVISLKNEYHELLQTSNEVKRQIQKIKLKQRIENFGLETSM